MLEIRADIHEVILSWLTGHSGESTGERILVQTYGENAWLGSIEGTDREFADRYHVQNGRILQSPLDISSGPEEDRFVRECGRYIKILKDRGVIVPIPVPRQYIGAATFYQLA